MPPQRRLSRSLPLLLSVAALACGGGVGPKDARAPAVGRYTYEADSYRGGANPWHYAGDLYITQANADSVVAIWDVPAFQMPAKLGSWNVDAYLVGATGVASGPGFINHRVATAGARSKLSCSGRDIESDGHGGLPSYPVLCTLTYVGPGAPPAYPNVSGSFGLYGSLGLPGQASSSISGSLSFAQPNRNAPDVTGTTAVTSSGSGSTGGLSQATVTPGGQITFYVGQAQPPLYWKFTGYRTGFGLGGTHELHSGTTVYTGYWDANRQ